MDKQSPPITQEAIKLKNKVTLSPLFAGFAALFGLMGLVAFVIAHEILLGLCCIIGAGIAGLIALKGSDAADSLEDMGLGAVAQNAKKSGVRLTVAILCIVALLAGGGYYISHQMDIQREKDGEEDWDRLAVATATVALDQYAPGTDYGPLEATGWTVIHNNDGTTTVWAPQTYGRIAVMLTDDGEDYTPYYISVDGVVVLDQ